MTDDLEALHVLKARYFRYLDTKRWREWGELFTPDAVFEIGFHYAEPLVGRDAIVGQISRNLAAVTSIHHGHTPELALIGPDDATGIWAMSDILITRSGPQLGREMHGIGHYYDRYRRVDGAWRIASMRLTRLHVSIDESTRYTDYPGGSGPARGTIPGDRDVSSRLVL